MSYVLNPAPSGQSAEAGARALYERFHGFAANGLDRRACPRILPPVLTGLGELRGLIYRSDRGQPGLPRTFVHFFDRPPLLASDPGGRRLYVVGGTYRVTHRGIEG